MGSRLDQHTAQGPCLDGPTEDGDLAGIGRQLAQERVSGAAADQVDHVHGTARQTGGITNGPAEGGGPAVENAPDDCGAGARHRLVGSPTGIGDPRRHVARRPKRRVVGVGDRSAGRQFPGRDEQGGEMLRCALQVPRSKGFLEHPQTHDVAVVSDSVVDATFVREIRQAATRRPASTSR